MSSPIEEYIDFERRAEDLERRADAASCESPLIYTDQEIADQWVLVPRVHMQTIMSWDGEITDLKAIRMITDIVADARLIGVKGEEPDVKASLDSTPGGP